MRILLSATILAGTAAALCLAVPAQAQGVPPNPFASNYPSAPPPPHLVERRERRLVRARRPRGEPAEAPGLLPPGRVPY